MLCASLLAGAKTVAQADITGALLVRDPMTSGQCPVSVTYTGTITGTPGTAFSLNFQHFTGGTPPTQVALGSRSIPPGGSLTVHDQIVVPASQTGQDQIWIHGIAGQPDIYSGLIAYTVNCGLGQATVVTGQPSPTPPVYVSPAYPPPATPPDPCASLAAGQRCLNATVYSENMWVRKFEGVDLICHDLPHHGFNSPYAIGQHVIGYHYFTSDQDLTNPCHRISDYAYRQSVKVILPALTGATLDHAYLVASTTGGSATPHRPCHLGSAYMTTSAEANGLVSQFPAGDSLGMSAMPLAVDYDVTQAVNKWQTGSPNHGLMVAGPDESLPTTIIPLANSVCLIDVTGMRVVLIVH